MSAPSICFHGEDRDKFTFPFMDHNFGVLVLRSVILWDGVGFNFSSVLKGRAGCLATTLLIYVLNIHVSYLGLSTNYPE
jgi:hypothetical protein